MVSCELAAVSLAGPGNLGTYMFTKLTLPRLGL